MLRIIVMLFGFVFVMNAHAGIVEECQGHQCLAVVDAGSTGSRLHVYAYDIDANNYPSHVKQVWSKKIQPGFATIAPTQDRIEPYLSDLFADASLQGIPVYFYATGGMRLLPIDEQMSRYKMLEHWFSMHQGYILADFKTISGRDEGLYGWLSINYQLGTFTSDNPTRVGLMDMGGASVQIVFPIDSNESMSSSDFIEVDVNGKHFSLFSHSFLGLGQTEVIKRFLDKEQCFSNDYPMMSGAFGRGDGQSCRALVSSFINSESGVDQLIQPILKANAVSEWYTMGGLSAISTIKSFHFSQSKMTSQAFFEQADDEICHQSWSDVLAVDPDNERTFAYCLISSYYYSLLVDGYGVNPFQTIQVLSDKESTDWSLGVVLQHH